MYEAFLISWAVCALALMALIWRAKRAEVFSWNPLLCLWFIWTAGAYAVSLVVNLIDTHLYVRIWPIREGLDLLFLAPAVWEVFRKRCASVNVIGKTAGWIANICLAVSVLLGVAVTVGTTQFWVTPIEVIMSISQLSGLSMAAFLFFVALVFRLTRQRPTPNMRIHLFSLAGFLTTWSILRLLVGFADISHKIQLAAMGVNAVILINWARRLRADGNVKVQIDSPVPVISLSLLVDGLAQIASGIEAQRQNNQKPAE